MTPHYTRQLHMQTQQKYHVAKCRSSWSHARVDSKKGASTSKDGPQTGVDYDGPFNLATNVSITSERETAAHNRGFASGPLPCIASLLPPTDTKRIADGRPCPPHHFPQEGGEKCFVQETRGDVRVAVQRFVALFFRMYSSSHVTGHRQKDKGEEKNSAIPLQQSYLVKFIAL